MPLKPKPGGRLLFVVMPWHALAYPSLGLGILTSLAQTHHPSWTVESLYANLEWSDYLLERTDGRLTPASYARIAEDLIFTGAGDWVFSGAMHGAEQWNVESYKACFEYSDDDFALAREAHCLAPAFIESLADRICGLNIDVVGLTSTFLQNVACISIAKAIKRRRPELVLVMGGGNCDGAMGPAIHRQFDCVDYVIVGAGEVPFRELLRFFDGDIDAAQVPGLCWRDAGGTMVNPRAPDMPISDIPIPNYDQYFVVIEQSKSGDFIVPSIVIETSRGCWWGQKHHCTFCGLNGSSMKFSSKASERVVDELLSLVSKYRVLDIITSDNIMDVDYFKTVLPALVELDLDLRLHYELKANLTSEQIGILKEAGVCHIQPGIESFSSHVLSLMQKGITGAKNVMALRDAEEANLTVSWNYLFGFPGENEEDYCSIIDQLKAVCHLQPPSGASRIVVERFSPYFERPELGFSIKRPARHYPVVYDLPDSILKDMVYMFDTDPHGISGAIVRDLRRGISDWRESYAGSTLTQYDCEGRIEICDMRKGWPRGRHVISEPIDIDLYRLLRRPTKTAAAASALAARGHDVDESDISNKLYEWKRYGLVFADNGLSVALATAPSEFRCRL